MDQDAHESGRELVAKLVKNQHVSAKKGAFFSPQKGLFWGNWEKARKDKSPR
jgi:hypothetical protein